MKKLFTFLLASLFIILHTGCQKDSVTPNNPSSDDSTKLVGMMIKTTFPNATQDSTITTFEYDVKKRLTLMKSYHPDKPDFNQKYVFQYNGTDTLPAVMIAEIHEGAGPAYPSEKDTAYFIYDDQGRIMKDSTIKNETGGSGGDDYYYYEVRLYTYSGGAVTVSVITTYPPSPGSYTETFTVTETNGNITSLKIEGFFIINFTYDNNPNPFHNIPALRPVFSVFTSLENGGYLSPLNILQKNNCTGYSLSINGDTDMVNNSYTSKTNRYPSAFVSDYTSTYNEPSPLHFEGTFEYDKW